MDQLKAGMKVSVFKGFSRQEGDASLLQKLVEIATGKHRKAVERIRELTAAGSVERASRIKRQLQACTFTATYTGRRVAEAIAGYNDLLVLDFDGMEAGEPERCKQQISEDEYVVFAFVSPSGNGLKAGVRLCTPEAERMRKELAEREEVSYEVLENYHKRMFEMCRDRYEALCKQSVDVSGSDVGRLCFLSYDPEIYIDRKALKALEALPVRIVVPQPEQEVFSPLLGKSSLREEFSGNPEVDCGQIDVLLQMEFQGCVNSVKRTMKFQRGQRNVFLYTLGNRCYRKNLPQKEVALLAEREFGGDPEVDVAAIIGNAYLYTGRTDRSEEEKKKPMVVRIAEFLEKNYEVRRNEVLQRLEYRRKSGGANVPFVLMKRQDFNSIYLDAQYAQVACQPFMVKTVIDSDFAKNYNPFEAYFNGLPPWDGVTDHIDRLAQTVQTSTQEFWRDCFKRWIVGLVACAVEEEKVNQLALILKGDQGKGKSTWIRQLLPPELKLYYRNGMLDPRNKDHMLLLSQRLLINLEEFEGMRTDQIGELKRLIAQEAVTERKAWDTDTDFYVRRASFVASTNEPRFLEDVTGTRRFPTVTAEAIDFHTPVDYVGVYSQAVVLWKSKFKYWYDEEEFQKLNAQNSKYSISSAGEELFYVYYRKPQPGDHTVRWMPASAILSYMSVYGKILMSSANIRILVRVLELDGFRKRFTANRLWEYEVVQKDLLDVDRAFKSPPGESIEPGTGNMRA